MNLHVYTCCAYIRPCSSPFELVHSSGCYVLSSMSPCTMVEHLISRVAQPGSVFLETLPYWSGTSTHNALSPQIITGKSIFFVQ